MTVKQKILLIEDNLDNSTLFCYLLKHAGYDVTAVTNTEDAAQILETMQPDVLLSDISLPGENGNNFLKKIRLRIDLKDICAIAVSAYAREEDKMRSLQSGYDAFIEKPIDVMRFAKQVAEIYEKKQATVKSL